MNRRALLISAAFTILGTALLIAHVRRLEQTFRGGPATRVLVLLKDSSPGTLLTRKLLGARDLPQSYLESRHVPASELEQVVGLSLGVATQANDTLLWTDLSGTRQPERKLSSLVPTGRRAFTLEATAARDRLLAPGDTVDLLAVEGESTKAGARLVAQNLLVLAVGGDLGGTGAKREQDRTATVSLSVSIAQARALAEAERRGRLRVAVRNPEDTTMHDEPPLQPQEVD